MCRLAGRHFRPYIIVGRRAGQRGSTATHLPPRAAKGVLSWGPRGCHAHPGTPDSCARVTAYCSFVTVRYDISCGGLSPEFMYATRAYGRQRCGCRTRDPDSAEWSGPIWKEEQRAMTFVDQKPVEW